jgi:hypothetical protein
MPKRFVDTTLGREPWFRKLSTKMKCAVRFLYDECDNIGVWVIDMETMSYFIGEEVTIEELFFHMNSDKDNRIELFKKDKIYIPQFISFQYGMLTDTCRPHRPIIEKLKKHGLLNRVSDTLSNTLSDTLEEKDKDKEKEQEQEKEHAIDVSLNVKEGRIKDFLEGQSWKEQFCMTKKISFQELEQLQEDWIKDIQLKGEVVQNYKQYFTNYYNKNLPKPSKRKQSTANSNNEW